MNAPDKALEIKAAIVAVFTFLTALFGWLGWAVIIWLAAMLIDYLTGTFAALSKGEWSSSKARAGLWHKIGAVAAVLVAALCDVAINVIIQSIGADVLPFEYKYYITLIVCLWYIFTEAGSILENAAALGAPVPKWLIKRIAQLKEAADAAGGNEKEDE